MELQNLSNEILLAKKAAKESGDLLINNKSEYNLRLNSNSKDTKLKADIESEEVIKSIITENSSFPILAEESGKSNDDLGDTFWVIDPLDGTANYNRNIPICCISIGLIKDMKPILGVVYDFNNDDMYVGDIYSKKSVMNDQIIKTSNISNKEEGILITGLPHDSDYSEQALSNMIDDMQKWQKIRMMGSAAMAACYVASGKVEQYQEKGIYLWDIVAGAAIVESSGGTAKIFNQKGNFQVDVVFSNSNI
jgi:myo-inositol-1(or 4)-monophosphatase